MWKITNTVMDRSKLHLQRRASKFEYHPLIEGTALRIGKSREITDACFTAMESTLRNWEGKGMISIEQLHVQKVLSAPVPEAAIQEVLAQNKAPEIQILVAPVPQIETLAAIETLEVVETFEAITISSEPTDPIAPPAKRAPGRPKRLF